MAERKRYIDVTTPIIGETMRVLGTLTDLHGKTIKLDLTRKMRGKGVVVTFNIFNHEEKLIAVPKKIEIVKSYIRRIARKRTDYVEDSFIARCQDFRAIVKPLLITRKRVSRAVRRNLRNTAREFLLEYLKERDYNEVCQELLDGTLQKTMLPKLKKVYPLSFCDIRIFETKEIEKIDLSKIKMAEEKIEEQEDVQGVPEEKSEVDGEVTREDSEKTKKKEEKE